MTGTPSLSDAEARAWSGHKRLSASLFTRLNRELLSAARISLPDYEVLESLASAPDNRLRAYELGTELQWEKSRLSHHLKRMETRGLVERVVCESDGRGVWVTLSRSGLSAYTAAVPIHDAQVREHLTASLTPADLTALAELSEKVIANLPDRARLCDT